MLELGRCLKATRLVRIVLKSVKLHFCKPMYRLANLLTLLKTVRSLCSVSFEALMPM